MNIDDFDSGKAAHGAGVCSSLAIFREVTKKNGLEKTLEELDKVLTNNMGRILARGMNPDQLQGCWDSIIRMMSTFQLKGGKNGGWK